MIERDEEAPALDVRPGLRASAWFLGGMALASAAAWLELPGDAQVPVHWGLDGRPDRFASKAQALLLMPALVVVTAAIMAGAPFLEPRRANLARSGKLYARIWVGSLVIMALSHAVILATAVGAALDVNRIVTLGVALLIAAIGDALAKSRSNFMAGLKTPWTLSSDLAWEMAHRWTGRLLVASGLASALASLAGPAALGVALLILGTFGSFGVGIALSYVYWKRDPERRS